MSRRLLLVAALVVLTAGMSLAQVGIGIDDPVILRTVPAANTQGVQFPAGLAPDDYSGDPDFGFYHILINGWIEAFAYVSVWDNWISFGIMDPDTGTFADPYSRWAFSQAGEATYASTGTNWNNMGTPGVEDGGQNPLYVVNSSTGNFDLAGFLVETNARLNLYMGMGGFMKRVDSTGQPFNGNDTRIGAGVPYQLANQYKMVFKGRFLEYVGADDPAQDEDGDQYVTLNTAETTDYNTWTSWDGAGAPGAIDNNNDWLWPVPAAELDPWTGAAALAVVNTRLGGPFLNLHELDLVVERGQAQGTPGSLTPAGADGPSEAAEVWFAERVMRRGLQDVAGNYRADRFIELTYREADTQWNPVQQ